MAEYLGVLELVLLVIVKDDARFVNESHQRSGVHRAL